MCWCDDLRIEHQAQAPFKRCYKPRWKLLILNRKFGKSHKCYFCKQSDVDDPNLCLCFFSMFMTSIMITTSWPLLVGELSDIPVLKLVNLPSSRPTNPTNKSHFRSWEDPFYVPEKSSSTEGEVGSGWEKAAFKHGIWYHLLPGSRYRFQHKCCRKIRNHSIL